jgi:hypothetical protein
MIAATALTSSELRGENGLGLANDPNRNDEITGTNLIRIAMPTGGSNILAQEWLVAKFSIASDVAGEN